MEEIRGPRYKIVVANGQNIPKWDPRTNTLIVSRQLLELDVKFSIAGERIAGLLLPLIDYENASLGDLIRMYRIRIAAEQAAELQSRIGMLSSGAFIRPAYFPISRALLLWRDLGCLVGEGLNAEYLDKEYLAISEYIGDLAEGLVRLKPRKYMELVKSISSAWRIKATGLVSAIARRISKDIVFCHGSGSDPPDPSPYLIPPEGRFFYNCLSPVGIASKFIGPDVTCKKAQWTASTLLCESRRGRVVVKEYTRMLVKWLPASIAGGGIARYLIRPKARMANEYKHLLKLRKILITPRILGFCGQYFKSVLVRSFIDGTPVLGSKDPEMWRLSGLELARIHLAGYVLGDPNPGNFILTREGMGLIDAEQARRFTPRRGAWDLVVYTFYSLLFDAKEDLVREGVRGYSKYMKERSPETLSEIKKNLKDNKLWGPLKFFVNIYPRARKILEEAIGEY